ncbi:MAG: glycosyltransferase family 4 protein [Thermosynechococcaceae cyanobacterium]
MDSSTAPKLLIVPGNCQSLGGTVTALSGLIKGWKDDADIAQLGVLVQADSLLAAYLTDAGHHDCLIAIAAQSKPDFLTQSLRWVNQQPPSWPLLLDNTVEKSLMVPLILAAPQLRRSGRCIYHFFHDSARSYNILGYYLRKFAFACLAPAALCNSRYTAAQVKMLTSNIAGIQRPAFDVKRFEATNVTQSPPVPLQPILDSGARIILNPSRITEPGIMNDKNLLTLIPMLAHLIAEGHHYHLVLMGEDDTPGEIYVQQLRVQAEQAGVSQYLTILPPSFEVERYYWNADIVVTLAPREPFGLIVVEAISAGIPVVGSSSGGIGETLGQFAPTWRVDPDDPVTAAQTVLHVLHDPKTPAFLRQGQQWARQNCDPVHQARHIMQMTRIDAVAPLHEVPAHLGL